MQQTMLAQTRSNDEDFKVEMEINLQKINDILNKKPE